MTRGLAQRIVRAAKKAGATITVCIDDGAENQSQSEKDIVDCMHCADEHHVTFHKDGLQRGWLLWLPDCDNSEADEAVCDYTANDFMDDLLKEAGYETC